ncbi:MAG: phasin family protein [Pseudomonadota bacterium]|nr:phasin family protein [Pseudomonadota bacterium]
MQNELIQKWTELNTIAMESIKELGEINTQAMTRLTQRQMEMVNIYMEGGAKQLEALSSAQGMPDMVAAQSQLFTELNQKLMDNAQQTVALLTEVKAELATWVEKNMEKTTQTTTQK